MAETRVGGATVVDLREGKIQVQGAINDSAAATKEVNQMDITTVDVG